MLPAPGGPDVLRVVDLPIEEPGPGKVRIRVTAAGVGSTDLMVLGGKYLFAPKIPFPPGYEVAGVVEAVGPGVTALRVGQRVAALTVTGAFAERLVRGAEHFVPIPDQVTDVDAAAVILNFVTAYQAIHRVAKVQPGETVLVTGAAGGVGVAALQLLAIAGAKALGAASAAKHGTVKSFGATPIDYRQGPLDRLVRAVVASGVDVALDGIGGTNIGQCLGALRRGGRLVAYGFMSVKGNLQTAAMFANIFIGSRLRGRRGSFYGITALYRRDPKPFREDLPKIFELLAARKISSAIARTFPLLDAAEALRVLQAGGVEGKIVLRGDAARG
jgi:NADPH2:quinone reductase